MAVDELDNLSYSKLKTLVIAAQNAHEQWLYSDSSNQAMSIFLQKKAEHAASIARKMCRELGVDTLDAWKHFVFKKYL